MAKQKKPTAKVRLFDVIEYMREDLRPRFSSAGWDLRQVAYNGVQMLGLTVSVDKARDTVTVKTTVDNIKTCLVEACMGRGYKVIGRDLLQDLDE